jgi:hypothetical protein
MVAGIVQLNVCHSASKDILDTRARQTLGYKVLVKVRMTHAA